VSATFRPRRTRVVRVDPQHPDAKVIAEAAGVLRAGGLVAFPTETVYGLGANALDEEAVLSIYAAKERDRDDPIIVHIPSIDGVPKVARDFPPLARTLAGRLWPGPLTIVLPRASAIAPAVSGGRDTVAVRVPSLPVAVALLRAAGVPVAAPSANRFMRTSGTTAAHVLEDLDGRVDLVLDGGPAPAGIESTVVAVEGDRVILLRPGAVTREALEAALAGTGATLVERGRDAAASASPGLLERHYAPRKPLTLVMLEGEQGFARMAAAANDAARRGERPGFLVTDEDATRLGAGAIVARLGAADNLAAVAQRLFAAMRELDASPATVLFARLVARPGMGEAINDRLRRASAVKIDR
jgi:L-threonylcarbamoyladenylate synthase